MMMRLMLASLLAIILTSFSFGQGSVTVSSTDGYNVKITISNLVLNKTPYPGNPLGGCNYTVTMNYKIQFTGPNSPSNMWTLQGVVRCNENTFFDLPNNAGHGTVTSANASYNGNPTLLTLTSICHHIDLEIHGPGINSMIVTIPIGGGSALPVELLDFNAEANGRQVELNWSTSSERDNDFFTVEKTLDGVNYVAVATVAGAGNSSTKKDYVYTDYNPSAGTSYYRLTQTDFNGAAETFEVKAVEVDKANLVSNVFPNPATDSRINVMVAETGSAVHINLYNMVGQLISTQIVDATSGNTIQQLELPENGNAFIIELTQDNQLIARHKIIAARN